MEETADTLLDNGQPSGRESKVQVVTQKENQTDVLKRPNHWLDWIDSRRWYYVYLDGSSAKCRTTSHTNWV
jgi:hypothetical protein